MTRVSQSPKECRECGKWLTLLTLWSAFGLGSIQMITGKLSGSVALSIEGLRSLTDGVGSVFVLAGLKLASKPRDASHPYGHGKAKFLASIVIYTALVGVGLLFLFESSVVARCGWTRVPNKMAVVVALLGIVANYVLGNYNRCAGKTLDRPVMIGNGYRNFTAVVSSGLVATGIVVAQFGYPPADPVAGTLVSLILLGSSLKEWWYSLSHLLDRSATTATIQKIRELTASVEGILGIGRIRTRMLGDNLWVDLDILVSPECSIEAANRLAAEVRGRLLSKAKRVQEIVVYYRSSRVVAPQT